MKNRLYMKRIKSMLLAIIMVIAVALPVSAAEPGVANEVTLNLSINNKLSAEVSPGALGASKNRASVNSDISCSISHNPSGFATAVLTLPWL